MFETLDNGPEIWKEIEIIILPGVTAMLAASARVGAPLGHDFCAINLSTNLKPWSLIKKRIALSLLFITQSKVWLLDEPFSALDSKAITIIESKIEEHCINGGLCILTTHQECNIKNLKEITL